MYSGYKRAEQSIRFTSEPSVPIIATAESLEEYQRLYRAALTPDTLRHLDQSQKQFKQWCCEMNISDQPPISPMSIAKYVEFLGGKVSLQTIKN